MDPALHPWARTPPSGSRGLLSSLSLPENPRPRRRGEAPSLRNYRIIPLALGDVCQNTGAEAPEPEAAWPRLPTSLLVTQGRVSSTFRPHDLP